MPTAKRGQFQGFPQRISAPREVMFSVEELPSPGGGQS